LRSVAAKKLLFQHLKKSYHTKIFKEETMPTPTSNNDELITTIKTQKIMQLIMLAMLSIWFCRNYFTFLQTDSGPNSNTGFNCSSHPTSNASPCEPDFCP
jgi:hypothetical protein